MNRLLFGIVIIFSILCSSCITNKDVVYLQDKSTIVNDSLQIVELSKPYRVQVSDILSISIKATDSEVKKLVESEIFGVLAVREYTRDLADRVSKWPPLEHFARVYNKLS